MARIDFVLPPDVGNATQAAAAIERLGWRVRPVREGAQEVTRFTCRDTWSSALDRAGYRLRTYDDGSWRLTRKGKTVARDICPPDAWPSGLVANRLRSLTPDNPCIVHLVVTRTRTRLSLHRRGVSRVRATLDLFEFSSPHRPERSAHRALLRVEDDRSAATRYLCTVLRRAMGGQPERRGILFLGLDALGVHLPRWPRPQGLVVRPTDTLGLSADRILRGLLRRMEASAGGAIADMDPEYVHELRVASRVLTHALWFLRPILPAERSTALRTQLQWLSGLLAQIRDADVFRSFLRAQAGAPVEALLDLVSATRRRAVAGLSASLDSPRFAGILSEVSALADLALRSEAQAAAQPVKPAAARIVRRALSRLRLYRDRRPRDMDDEELHEARSKVRRLRFACELFRTAYGRRMRRTIAEVVVLQDCLGQHQDAHVAVRRLEALAQEAAAAGLGTPEVSAFIESLIRTRADGMRRSRERLEELWPGIRVLGRRIRGNMGPETPQSAQALPPPAIA